MELTSKQRAYLGGCASTLDPIFQIGKASLTPEIIQALDEALELSLIHIYGGKSGAGPLLLHAVSIFGYADTAENFICQ